MSLQPVLSTVRKDLLLFFGDRRAVVVTLVTPVLIAAFFGYLFSGKGSSETARIPVLVADLDASAVSKSVILGLKGDKYLEVRDEEAEKARAAVLNGKASAAVILPQGFGKAAGIALFGSGPKPEVQVLYDPSHGAEMGMVRGILTEHVMGAVSRETFGGSLGREVVRESLQEIEASEDMDPRDKGPLSEMLQSVDRWNQRVDEARQSGKPVQNQGLAIPYSVREEAVTAGKVAYNGYAHSFAGMGVQFILFAAIELGMAVLLERREGFWKRLRSAPVSKGSVLLAKMLSGSLIAFLCLAVTFGAGILVFGVRIRGSVPGFLGLCLASALLAAAFGLMLAALGRTPQATRGIAIFAVLLMVMLGGGWVPAFLFPKWLQTASLAIPARWAVDGFDAVTWRGLGIGSALGCIAVILGFTALFTLVAAARFPWEKQ